MAKEACRKETWQETSFFLLETCPGFLSMFPASFLGNKHHGVIHGAGFFFLGGGGGGGGGD